MKNISKFINVASAIAEIVAVGMLGYVAIQEMKRNTKLDVALRGLEMQRANFNTRLLNLTNDVSRIQLDLAAANRKDSE